MKERPILFSGSLPSAIIAGIKNQTRRLVKPQPELSERAGFVWKGYAYGLGSDNRGTQRNFARPNCPYGQPGERLYVKETFWAWGRWETRFDPKKGRDAWHFVDMTRECGKEYQFEQPAQVGTRRDITPAWHKRPSIFMTRQASRITLEITGVRVERLHEISEEDARAEGVEGEKEAADAGLSWHDKPRRAFRFLWERINGPDSWAANPYVWVVEFKRVDKARAAA